MVMLVGTTKCFKFSLPTAFPLPFHPHHRTSPAPAAFSSPIPAVVPTPHLGLWFMSRTRCVHDGTIGTLLPECEVSQRGHCDDNGHEYSDEGPRSVQASQCTIIACTIACIIVRTRDITGVETGVNRRRRRRYGARSSSRLSCRVSVNTPRLGAEGVVERCFVVLEVPPDLVK